MFTTRTGFKKAPTYPRFAVGFVAVLASMVVSSLVSAQTPWNDVDAVSVQDVIVGSKYSSIAANHRIVALDLDVIESVATGVLAKSGAAPVLSLPAPNGGAISFILEPSGVLPAALREKYPSILAFKGYAISDPSITLRFELTDKGFSAQVLQPGNRWMIDPLSVGQKGLSIVYYTKDTKRNTDSHSCEFEGGVTNLSSQADFKKKLFAAPKVRAPKTSGNKLRTYRLAVAATGEYGAFHGGQKSTILSAITTTINRVTGILEKEMSLSLELVPDNDVILFTSAAESPFTGNNSASILIDESQVQIDSLIGSDNYDIGHTFSTGAGGLAALGSVCSPLFKAKGVTGSSQPRGEYFDVDFVAHEIGHQLGANHTFNGANGACAGSTRNYLTAYEPGSGSTIQAYPSLCGVDDLQNAVDPIYHSESFDEIRTNIAEGLGGACGTLQDTGNTAPVVDAGNDFSVPKGTPLVVTGSATDSEQSTLTYLWEQRDLGAQAALSASDDGEIPLFRVLTPSSSPIRYLPSLPHVVSGNYSDAEKIPQVARDLNLRLTARDGVGGVSSDDIVVTVSGSAGPFSLLTPNGGEVIGKSKTIRWDVSQTDQAPVNTSQVEIFLSTDGGVSFDTSLGVTDNDGLASVSFPPGIRSTTARIMIRAKDNIFYDVSDENFTVDSDQPVPPAPTDTALTPVNGGVIVAFTPGLDNGVPITHYEVACRADTIFDEYTYSVAPGVAIPDQGTIESTLSVDVDLEVEEGGVKVPVDISHTYRGDIVLVLQSPAGTSVRLKNSLESDGGADVVGVFPSTLAAEDSLDTLVGESSLGDWKLTVTDSYYADTGTLNSWGLDLLSITPGDEVTNQGVSSPIVLSGMQNEETYSCEITAFAGDDPSETVAMGQVTPTAPDSDGDGVEDDLDAFPFDGSETLDTDSDGVGNNADTDDDNDGVADGSDAFPLDPFEIADTDQDGVGNNADADDDGDGVSDDADAFPLDGSETLDTDSDGVGNNADTDDDGDGVEDTSDALPLDANESVDTDGDGVGNNADTDDDGDGVSDDADAFPLDGSETLDTDSDGVGNNADTDDDGDGVEDTSDALPLDANESVDTDGDGIGNNADSDDDGDGVEDASDAFPTDASESVDSDGDGVGDTADAFPTDAERTQPPWSSNALVFNRPLDDLLISENEKGWRSYLRPSNSEGTGRVENSAIDTFPIQFEYGGTLFFAAGTTSGQLPEIAFQFENSASEDAGDVYTTEPIRVGEFGSFVWLYSVSIPALPGKTFDSVSMTLLTEDVELLLPWARLSEWQAGTTEELLDSDGKNLTLLTTEATAGGAFTNGLCGYDSETGWEPYCGSYPESSRVKWEPIVVSEGRIGSALSISFDNEGGDGYFHINSGQPLDLSPYYDRGILSFDLRVPDGGATAMELWVHCTSYPNCYGDLYIDLASAIPGEWTRFEVSLAELEFNGLFLGAVDIAFDITVLGIGNERIGLANVEYLLEGPEDADGDGVRDVDDAFPDDPAASLDSDGDGAPDRWNADATQEQLVATTLVLDAFPSDATETIDTDGDGIGNNSDTDDDGDNLADSIEVDLGTDPLEIDTDGDGTGDGIDRFPLDPLEYMDLDDDGVGDNADFDDDSDSIIDQLDVFPRESYQTPLIAADLSSATIPHGLVEFVPSATDDPWAAEGWLSRAWMLKPDGSYRANTTHAGQAGTWRAIGNGYRLDRTTDRYFIDNTRWLDPMQHVNIDWDYVRTTLATESESNGLDYEVREVLETRLAVIESDSDSITLASTVTWRRYALDPNVAVDPELPIEVFEFDVVEREILSTEINPVVFSPNELLGTWVIKGLNEDDYDLAARCIFSGGYSYNRSQCSDHITFFDDNTAELEHSGRTAVWAIADDGSVTVDFDDNGTRVSLLRIAKGDDTSSVLVSFETEEEYYAQVNMMIKVSVPEPRSLAGFIDQGFLMNSFGVTNDTWEYRRSLTDGGYIGGFGFKLNSDGTGGRYAINNSVSTLDSGRDVITGFSNELPITWAQDGNTITSYACLNRVGEEALCYQEQVRTWELIKTTATRFYVNEVLAWRFDYDADGEVDEESIYASRPNFYELVPYYDTSDLDRDGYPNNIDAFPTDERQFQDADGDGIGDNPLLPGDIDGDGVEDTFDTFPLDAAESLDTDSDGIGNNADTDDDNDGFSDSEEIQAGSDPLSVDSLPSEADEQTGGLPVWLYYIATQPQGGDLSKQGSYQK
jgi:subtilisin-like proprotein convertase family protein